MSTDKLINKYLDGELTREEDKQLRKLLNEDAQAREDFYTGVEMHLGIKEDAKSIEPPESLLRNTEDKVLMKILGAGASYTPSKKQPAYSYLAVAVVILMFGFVYQIYEPQINSGIGIGRETAQNNAIEKNIEYDDINTDDKSFANSEETNDNQLLAATDSDFYNGTSENLQNKVFGEDLKLNFEPKQFLPSGLAEIASDDVSESTSDKSSGENIENIILSALGSPVSDNVLNVQNQRVMNGNSQLMLNNSLFNSNRVVLTSFVSNGLSSTGINLEQGSNVVNYSQSIAYTSTDKSNVGLELGYMEFSTYNNVRTNPANANKFNSHSSVEEFNDDLPNDGFVPPTVPVNVKKQYFWGSVFYERNLLNYNDKLYLDGRLGLGATSNGPLAYTRFYGKLRLIDGIYFSVGSEYRTFMVKDNFRDKNYWGSTLSWMYGIQFSF